MRSHGALHAIKNSATLRSAKLAQANEENDNLLGARPSQKQARCLMARCFMPSHAESEMSSGILKISMWCLGI